MTTDTAATPAADPSISDIRAMLAPEAAAPPAEAKPATEKKPDSEPAAAEGTPARERGEDGKFKAADKAAEAPAEGAEPGDTPNVQKRISKLVAEARQAQRERDELKAKLATGSQPENKAQPAAAAPTGKPDPKKFSTYEEYTEALALWTVESRLAREDQTKQQAKAGETWKQRVAAATEAYPDYDEVMTGAASLPISQVMHEAIIDSELGPQLAYYLATNPDEAARIQALSPNAGAREMGKIEAKLAAAKPAEPSKPAAAAAAPAKPAAKPLPKPAAPVGGSHAPSEVDLNDPDLSMETFSREFKKRLKPNR
jgi:hypothetical protein